MNHIELAFQEFVDELQTANDSAAFERVAIRLSNRLGFRWFAYLRLDGSEADLISSYPVAWTVRYFERGYETLDPIVVRSRRERNLFRWSGDIPTNIQPGNLRRFFDEASTFGIKEGVTVPIIGGYGRCAAFTMATDERTEALGRIVNEFPDVLSLVGLYFHTHATTKLAKIDQSPSGRLLSQRESQCLAWAARGKTIAEIATIVGIRPRTVTFHLENARGKLEASSLTQAVAIALRQGRLP